MVPSFLFIMACKITNSWLIPQLINFCLSIVVWIPLQSKGCQQSYIYIYMFKPLNGKSHIINRIRQHSCSRADLGSMRAHFQRKKTWNGDAKRIGVSVVEECTEFLACAPPFYNWKVSITDINRSLNTHFCWDHSWPDDQYVFLVMKSSSSLYAAQPVRSISVFQPFLVFESLWTSNFCPRILYEVTLPFVIKNWSLIQRSVACLKAECHLAGTTKMYWNRDMARSSFQSWAASPGIANVLAAVFALKSLNNLSGSDTVLGF